MPYIRTVSDLRNKYKQISKLCHDEDEPVFITKNGKNDMVLMSLTLYEKKKTLYEKQQALLEIYQKLSEAEAESEPSKTKISHRQLMDEMKAKINEKKI